MPFKREKLATNLRELAAQFLQETKKSSLVTVTSVTISDDMERATVGFTVFPEEKEEAALTVAKRRQKAFRAFAAARLRTRRIPWTTFVIDLGEKNRQRVDELLREDTQPRN
jgi:ribosome-binding factor A